MTFAVLRVAGQRAQWVRRRRSGRGRRHFASLREANGRPRAIPKPGGVASATPRCGRFAFTPVSTYSAAAPDSLTYATSGVGGVLHLQAELLAQTLGTRFVHVPYRSGAQMLQAIHTGEAQFGVAAVASAAAMLKEGMVRPVAMLGPRRFPLFPGVPTAAELGIQGFDNPAWFALVAPAGVPAPVTEALNRALLATLAEPGVVESLVKGKQ